MSNRPGNNRGRFLLAELLSRGHPALYSSFADGCRTCYAAPVSLT
jgi:hypothetical protein